MNSQINQPSKGGGGGGTRLSRGGWPGNGGVRGDGDTSGGDRWQRLKMVDAAVEEAAVKMNSRIKVTNDKDCSLMISVFRLKKILMRVEYLRELFLE
ncbi:hypothetical protein Tco_0811383 [Tanacetum coccineum]